MMIVAHTAFHITPASRESRTEYSWAAKTPPGRNSARSVCSTGSADIPRYDIATDRSVGTTRFCRDDHPVFVAEGVFVGQVVQRCEQEGLLADAIVITRSPWKNFARRLARDLAERRKPPRTLLRRGRALMRQESALVARLVDAGCRPLDGAAAVAALAGWSRTTALDPTD